MAKQSPKPPSPPAPQQGKVEISLGYDPAGPKEPVDVLSSKENWSEYSLSDGTLIRVKTVILDVEKMIGQYTPEGDPVYVMKTTMVNQTRVPADLKKKG
jgi:hypothetical protein